MKIKFQVFNKVKNRYEQIKVESKDAIRHMTKNELRTQATNLLNDILDNYEIYSDADKVAVIEEWSNLNNLNISLDKYDEKHKWSIADFFTWLFWGKQK